MWMETKFGLTFVEFGYCWYVLSVQDSTAASATQIKYFLDTGHDAPARQGEHQYKIHAASSPASIL